jgi:hypothetical protein
MKNILGYRIFFRYLENIWNAEEHDWLGGMLGGMSLLSDGSTADPVYTYDWDKAIEKISEPDDLYQIGIQFLKDYLAIGYIDEIGQILTDMENKARLDLWEKAEYDVAHGLNDPDFHILPEDNS